MKKIVIISDTHLPKGTRSLPEPLILRIKQCDYLIHAGDFIQYDFYKELDEMSTLIGVHGNVDEPRLQKELPEKRIIEIENVRIGITHGHGRSYSTIKRVTEAFKNDHCHLLIFGHSHIPLLQEQDGITLFNPGSPTDKRFQTYYSYGILTIDNGKFEINHIVFS